MVRRAVLDGWSNTLIENLLKEATEMRNFDILGGDVRIERPQVVSKVSELKTEVTYTRVIRFIGFEYRVEFEAKVSSVSTTKP